MTSKRMLVMPPIYRFSLINLPKESGWGWHRAVEVVEAVNNLLTLKGKATMTPKEINETFPFAEINNENSNCWTCLLLGTNGNIGTAFIGSVNWLTTVIQGDYYIPAKLGMQLITAVKNPAYKVFKNILAGN